MQFDDEREDAKRTISNIEKETRERLVRDYPRASPGDIEDMLLLILRKGMAPTTATITPNQGIPKGVQDARRAERQAQVKARKFRRRGG